MSYLYHAYLSEVYEPWIYMEGSEWGEALKPLHQAYSDHHILSDEEREELRKILFKYIEEAMNSGWMEEYYDGSVREAREMFATIQSDWKKTAEGGEAKNLDEFHIADATIPDWMREGPKEEKVALYDHEIDTLKALANHQGLMYFDILIREGYVKKWPSGYEITTEGRKALDDALG